MQEYVINRPDEGAMEQILQKNFENGLLKENGYIIVVSKEPT